VAKNMTLGSNPMMKTLLAASAVLTLAAGGHAFAANELQPRTRVPVSGIDFSNPEQAKLTYIRLKNAANAACASNSANPRVVQDDIRCSRAALATAVAQLNRPTVTAMYQSNYGAQSTGLATNDQ
jgi:UrcA family protein